MIKQSSHNDRSLMINTVRRKRRGPKAAVFYNPVTQPAFSTLLLAVKPLSSFSNTTWLDSNRI